MGSIDHNHSPLRHTLVVEQIPIDAIKPPDRRTRRHDRRQVDKIARSLAEFGVAVPVIIDRDSRVIDGWAVLEACRRLDLTSVPCIRLDRLSAPQARALRLALNRIAEDATWDPAELRLEFLDLVAIDTAFDLTVTGFETPEIDLHIGGSAGPIEEAYVDALPDPPKAAPVTRIGDLWRLGEHRVICGDARAEATYRQLLGSEAVRLILTDPPYNVPIEGHVSGKGRRHHAEFAMGSGEMTAAEFEGFLAQTLGAAAAVLVAGGLAYVFMDWRHLPELGAAATRIGLVPLAHCVWVKTNAGMGSLYRSQHEHIAIYKKGTAPHVNNVELGRHGRSRSTVWTHAGANSVGAKRDRMLAAHPTVKPVALVAEAILDVTLRGDLVLDPFAGSGTTLIAAHQVGRRARLVEIDPAYVDLICTRWRILTGTEAVLAETGEPFPDVRRRRESAVEEV